MTNNDVQTYYAILCRNTGMWQGMETYMKLDDRYIAFKSKTEAQKYCDNIRNNSSNINNFNSYFVEDISIEDYQKDNYIIVKDLKELEQVTADIHKQRENKNEDKGVKDNMKDNVVNRKDKQDKTFTTILKENEEDNIEMDVINEDLKNQWIEFLKKEVRDNCNENNSYEIYWQNGDEVSPQDIKDAMNIVSDNNDETFESVLLDKIYEYNEDYEDNFIDTILADMPEELEDFAEDRDILDDLYEYCGYNGLDLNISELLDRTVLKINILFATPTEQNYDMSSIINCYGSWRAPEYETIDEKDFDNGMTYLIHQQGHSVKEYYDCLNKNPGGFSMKHENTFIESCVDDCVNNTSDAMSVMTFCATVSGEDIERVLSYKNTKGKYIEINKDAYGGTFNSWAGSGGVEIELEKPVVIPTDYIYDIQIEGAKNDSGYSVNDVFGLSGDCWDAEVKECSAPTLYEEDMSEVVEYIRQFADEDEEVEESKEIKTEEVKKPEVNIKWQDVENFDDMSGNSDVIYGELDNGTYYLYIPREQTEIGVYDISPKETIEKVKESIAADFNEDMNVKAWEEYEKHLIDTIKDTELYNTIMKKADRSVDIKDENK